MGHQEGEREWGGGECKVAQGEIPHGTKGRKRETFLGAQTRMISAKGMFKK